MKISSKQLRNEVTALRDASKEHLPPELQHKLGKVSKMFFDYRKSISGKLQQANSLEKQNSRLVQEVDRLGWLTAKQTDELKGFQRKHAGLDAKLSSREREHEKHVENLKDHSLSAAFRAAMGNLKLLGELALAFELVQIRNRSYSAGVKHLLDERQVPSELVESSLEAAVGGYLMSHDDEFSFSSMAPLVALVERDGKRSDISVDLMLLDEADEDFLIDME